MNEHFDKRPDSVYSKRLKAGKRRTYFFDVRATRGNDFFITITESRKRPNDDGYDRHKIFLYKEDFNKFIKGLSEAVDFVKTDLMPDFDFDSFNHDQPDGENAAEDVAYTAAAYIAPELINPKLPDNLDEKELDGVAAHRDIIDGTSLSDVVDGVPVISSSSLPEGKKITSTGISEEVDKW